MSLDERGACYPRRVSTEQEPICPACGYLRTGIAPDAKCPECGADGLDAWVVVVGRPRVYPDAVFRLLAAISIPFGIAALFVAILGGRGSDRLVPFAALMLVVSLVLLGSRAVGKRLGLLSERPIVWCAHPDGISVRQGRSVDFIARRDIASIGSAESVFGELTVLSIVRSRASAKGLVGTTPYLYLHGPRDERATIVRSLKQVLAPPTS